LGELQSPNVSRPAHAAFLIERSLESRACCKSIEPWIAGICGSDKGLIVQNKSDVIAIGDESEVRDECLNVNGRVGVHVQRRMDIASGIEFNLRPRQPHKSGIRPTIRSAEPEDVGTSGGSNPPSTNSAAGRRRRIECRTVDDGGLGSYCGRPDQSEKCSKFGTKLHFPSYIPHFSKAVFPLA
jgi:hypothetical protein